MKFFSRFQLYGRAYMRIWTLRPCFANKFFFHPSIEQGGNTGNAQTMSSFAFKACRLLHFRQNLVQAVNTYGHSNANLVFDGLK